MTVQSGGPFLPPLTEKIDRGAGGGLEFERLMTQLLLVDATVNRYIYEPAAGMNDGGVDGLAPHGVPGFDARTAFQFKWLWDDIHENSKAQQITRLLRRATESQRQRGIQHWILVTPREIKPAESAWLAMQAKEYNLSVHHWGQAKIEQLLRACPALMARYYPGDAPLKDFDGTDFRKFAGEYRAKVAIAYKNLKTIGFPPETKRRSDSQVVPLLAEIFIPLRLVPEDAGAEPQDLARVLGAGSSVVVLGEPGMGKSTLLAYLALIFSGEAKLEGFAPTDWVVPLVISLREYVRAQGANSDLTFLEYLASWARERLQLPRAHWAFFEAALRMGEAVVLVDGLDEVGSEAARHRVATTLRTFLAQFQACPCWVTCRSYGYTSSVRLTDEFKHYRVDWLDDDRVNSFIDRWYAIQVPHDPADSTARAKSLRAAVHHTPSVRRLARNPLLLTLMAFIHHSLRKLPHDRGELYEKSVEMLLKTWQEMRRDAPTAQSDIRELNLDVQTQKEYLAHLAFFMQEKTVGEKSEKKWSPVEQKRRGLLPRSEVVESLTARHWAKAKRSRPGLTEAAARMEMQCFLEYICEETV